MFKFALMVLLALGMGVVWGCEHENSAQQAQQSTASVAGIGFAVGQVAPSFKLERVDGGRLASSDLSGKVVLLDFWDTWCPPCRKALPHLQEISEEYPDGFEVVGVALGQEGPAKVKSFIAGGGFSFPFVQGNGELFQKFGVQSLPTTFLLDKEGVIRKRWVGGYPKVEYEKAVKELLGS